MDMCELDLARGGAVTDGLSSTNTLCPVCLQAVPGRRVSASDSVVIEGACPEHGTWRTPVWSGPPSIEAWLSQGSTEPLEHTCTAVLEVTRRCNLACPVCFADSSPQVAGAGADPSLTDLGASLAELFETAGEVNLQLSGGEPTVRNDLPALVAAAREAGFTFVQLNTNGLRLASEDGYAESLRDAGLASVFLQFDGVSEATQRALRGRPLLAEKLRAIGRCAEANLAVVLVPTIVPGVNDHELGDLVRLAVAWPGVVRGLHLQPISYFGRYPQSDRGRLTLPELLRRFEEQTEGVVRAADFSPSCCEHALCAFRARYWVREGGSLEPVRAAASSPPDSSCCTSASKEPSRRAVAATSRQWSRRVPAESRDGLDRFLDEADRILAISGMLFQDAWNLDLERVGRCCVKVVTPGQGLVSFCLWNLTGKTGQRLHPR
jgi:7,8-dihydro-6-hydroxymethylpterin dimethyltransferase